MPAGHNLRVKAGRELSYMKRYWLYHSPSAEEAEEATAEEAENRATKLGLKRPRTMDEMHTNRKDHMHKQQRLRAASKDSIYHKAWKATANIADLAPSNCFMRETGITDK